MLSTPSTQILLNRIRIKLGIPLVGHVAIKRLFADGIGIEIGGPSRLFERRLAIYAVARQVDQLNFSADTVWSRLTPDGAQARPASLERGRSIVCDGSDLHSLASASYDFLLSCHNLEHLANPLKALKEWKRVVKPGGHLLLVLPNKTANFDHRRPTTAFEHLLDDERRDVDEHDLTHLSEILELHDLSRDPEAGSFEQFKARSQQNHENRCLHHHVFDMALLHRIATHLGLQVVAESTSISEFVVVAAKPAAAPTPRAS